MSETGRPCSCGNARVGQPLVPGECVHCWSWLNAPEYRAARQGKQLASRPAPPGPCRHLGAATGETVTCPSCQGAVELKLFGCALHGDCTPQKAAPGHVCCRTCPDWAAGPVS